MSRLPSERGHYLLVFGSSRLDVPERIRCVQRLALIPSRTSPHHEDLVAVEMERVIPVVIIVDDLHECTSDGFVRTSQESAPYRPFVLLGW